MPCCRQASSTLNIPRTAHVQNQFRLLIEKLGAVDERQMENRIDAAGGMRSPLALANVGGNEFDVPLDSSRRWADPRELLSRIRTDGRRPATGAPSVPMKPVPPVTR